jgi:beta-galactosidase
VATAPDPATLAALLRRAWTEAGVEPAAPDLPEGVEAVRRVTGDTRLLFVLNHRPEGVEVPLPAGGVDLLSGEAVAEGRLALPARGVAIIQEA